MNSDTMNTSDNVCPVSPESAFSTHYKVIAPLLMCSGVGDGRNTACVMAQAATINALRHGLTLDKPTDEMECACPVLRRLAIRANDTNWWASNEERTEFLRPLIPLLLDSRGDDTLTKRRMFFVVDNSVRVITPMRLEFRAGLVKDEKAKALLLEGAKAMREIPEITDTASALAARDICETWRKSAAADAAAYAAYADAAAYAAYADAAAYAAYADADAYAYAYADAYAYTAYAYAAAAAYADADADAAAYAYADAAAAAHAAVAYADAAAAQKRIYRDAFLEMFRAAHALK